MELRAEEANAQGLQGEQMLFPERSFREGITRWTGKLVLRCGRF